MSSSAQLLLWIAGLHLLGLACVAALIVPMLREPPDDGLADGGDDGGGNEPRRPTLNPRTPFGGLPLPDAVPARVRLRGHERLGDAVAPHERRPAREPERAPARQV